MSVILTVGVLSSDLDSVSTLQSNLSITQIKFPIYLFVARNPICCVPLLGSTCNLPLSIRIQETYSACVE